MAARAFNYSALPIRVTFGAGSVQHLDEEIEHLGFSKVLVISGPGQRTLAETVAVSLGDRAVGVLADAVMHVPAELADTAQRVAEGLGADSCVAIGGGSTIGLGKAIALARGLPVIAVPTTYAGSEMTPIWGLTKEKMKRTGRDLRVLPVSVVYDPLLTHSLPVGLSVTSGMNAVAHAVEALYAPDGSPVISLMAEEGVRAMIGALPILASSPDGPSAREDALYAAWLCGACLGATTMSLHHKLCHVLGGTLGLPHAETHTVMLPHVLRLNAPSAPSAMAVLRRALDTDDPAALLQQLPVELGAPGSLRDLGVQKSDLPQVIEQVLATPYANPRSVDGESLRDLLNAAYSGVQAV